MSILDFLSSLANANPTGASDTLDTAPQDPSSELTSPALDADDPTLSNIWNPVSTTRPDVPSDDALAAGVQKALGGNVTPTLPPSSQTVGLPSPIADSDQADAVNAPPANISSDTLPPPMPMAQGMPASSGGNANPGFLQQLSAVINPNHDYADNISKFTDQNNAKQLNDPNSVPSKLAQLAMKNLPQYKNADLSGFTAAQGLKLAPAYFTPIINANAKAAALQGTQNRQDQRQSNQTFNKLDTEMNPYTSSNRTLGSAQMVINSGQRLSGLALDANGNVQNVTPTQFNELGGSLARMVQGGQVGIGSLKEFIPANAATDGASLLTYLTAHPELADNKALVQMMYNTAQREQGIAKDQIKDANINTLANSWSTIKTIDQNRANAEAKKLGVSPQSLEDGTWTKSLSNMNNPNKPTAGGQTAQVGQVDQTTPIGTTKPGGPTGTLKKTGPNSWSPA